MKSSGDDDLHFEILCSWLKEETGYQQIQGTKPQTPLVEEVREIFRPLLPRGRTVAIDFDEHLAI